MPLSTPHTATLTIDELAALAAEIQLIIGPGQRHDPATAKHVEAICGRRGLVFTDASIEEMPCR